MGIGKISDTMFVWFLASNTWPLRYNCIVVFCKFSACYNKTVAIP